MDFVANGSKNVEIETSTGVYLRHAIQTHFVEIGEDYIELVNRYVMQRLYLVILIFCF